MILENNEKESLERESGIGSGLNALARSFRYVVALLTLFVMGTVAWYFTFLGYFTVDPQEAVILLRFGKISEVFTEDWHWAFPYPVSRIVRIPTSRQVMQIKNFWPNPDVSMTDEQDALSKMAVPIMPGRDGSLLTGDANIVHTEWEIVYEVKDPLAYYSKLFCPQDPRSEDEPVLRDDGRSAGTRGPRTTLASIVENEIIKATAVQKVENTLYKDVTGYQEDVSRRIASAFQALNAGVELSSAVLKSKTPPFSTVSAFHDVINAEQESSSAKLKAINYSFKSAQESETESREIIVDAEVYRSRTVSEIESESKYFEKILVEYRKNPESVIIPLYSETLVSLLRDVKDKYIVPDVHSNETQELRIMLSPEPDYKKDGAEKKAGEN